MTFTARRLWERVIAWGERLAVHREQARCSHQFRPARLNGHPARFCSICRRTDTLSPAEYYAQFGERGWQW